MWRVIYSVNRGLRSVRPSKCCSQDCSEEGPNKYHSHHHLHNEVSKAKAATLQNYSAASCRISLTVKKYDDCLGVVERLHTGSYDNRSPSTESRGSGCFHPRCPPWHWKILQENNKLEEPCSEKEENKEKESRRDWEKTCHFEEWKEVLQSSPTLHALGWGSAAALTWSLYHDWNKHHLCPYQIKSEQLQTSLHGSRKDNSVPKDIKNEDQKNERTQNYHKPFKDIFAFHSNIKVSSEFNSDNFYKDYSKEIYEVPNLEYNCNDTNTHKLNMVPHGCSSQETIIPIYSLQQNFLDITRKVFKNQENNFVKEKHKLQETTDEKFHSTIKLPFFLEDKWFKTPDKTDVGCISESNQSLQSQTCNGKPQILQNHYSQNDKSKVIQLVSDICPERPPTEASKTELSAEEEDVSDYHQSTAQSELCNNLDEDEIKMLQDKLLKIVKTHHKEQLLETLKDENALLDTKLEEMIVYFQAGVLVGDSTSAFNLALCYHMGRGTTQDLEKARKLYEVASAAGHGWATYNLAVMLNQGLGGPFLPQKAHTLLLQAAKMGVKEAVEVLLRLEEEEDPQQTVSQEEETGLRQCYSEPCLLSPLNKEWPLSYSTGDLHSLLDEDDWTAGNTSTVANVSQIT